MDSAQMSSKEAVKTCPPRPNHGSCPLLSPLCVGQKEGMVGWSMGQGEVYNGPMEFWLICKVLWRLQRDLFQLELDDQCH